MNETLCIFSYFVVVSNFLSVLRKLLLDDGLLSHDTLQCSFFEKINIKEWPL